MSIKPILFNTDMVRAIMDGRKNVTRRVIKPQPKCALSYAFAGHGAGKWSCPYESAYEIWGERYRLTDDITEEDKKMLWTPPCHADDILYVRETWGISNLDYDDKVAYIVYKASENEENEGCREIKLPDDKFEKLYDSMAENSADWRPSIHMPKEAARIFLKVKDVRVERLQEITEEQALSEGVPDDSDYPISKVYCPRCRGEGLIGAIGANLGYMDVDCPDCDTAIKRFKNIWNSTIKKSDAVRYGWDANPWVWVMEFEKCDKPEGWCSND